MSSRFKFKSIVLAPTSGRSILDRLISAMSFLDSFLLDCFNADNELSRLAILLLILKRNHSNLNGNLLLSKSTTTIKMLILFFLFSFDRDLLFKFSTLKLPNELSKSSMRLFDCLYMFVRLSNSAFFCLLFSVSLGK